MKKLFFIIIVVFAGTISAKAQVWIGGSANIFANKAITAFEIAPEVGYTIPNTKWTIAAGIDAAFIGDEYAIAFSPYVRYNVTNIEKFSFFVDLTGDFCAGSLSGYRIGLQPGIAWMATKHWTAAFRFAFLGYNDCAYYNSLGYQDGFNLVFATATGGFGLYYNF
jgi:hypothetical protein